MIKIIKGDITTLNLDCIVNAANTTLLGGGGVDGAIHRAAGIELDIECACLDGCKTGEAKITHGYRLPAKYVIHTVGPIYNEYEEAKSCEFLKKCYESSLNLAMKYKIESIAFPSISTGAYCFPLKKACKIALKTINEWQKSHSDYKIDVIICCYDDKTLNAYMEEYSYDR